MARIRSIKPEFWTSEQVMECSPLARLLFIGLWNFCDDAGNHPASAKTIKAEVFPGDDISALAIQGMLDELSANGLLAFYEHDGKGFLHVTGWQHQKIEKPTFKHPKYEPAKEGAKPTGNGGMPLPAPTVGELMESHRRVVGDSSPNDRLPLDPGVEWSGEEKKEEQKTPLSGSGTAAAAPGKGKADPLEGFAEFWLRYPKKKSKQDAEKAWAKLKPSAELRVTLMGALDLQAKSEDWVKQNGQFVPNAATWLNGRRWEDEVRSLGLGNHHGLSGERQYTTDLEANGDGTYRY